MTASKSFYKIHIGIETFWKSQLVNKIFKTALSLFFSFLQNFENSYILKVYFLLVNCSNETFFNDFKVSHAFSDCSYMYLTGGMVGRGVACKTCKKNRCLLFINTTNADK